MSQSSEVRRGTRKRSLVMAGSGFAALAAMFTAASQNALAVNFTSANTPMKVYTNYVQGVQAAGFLDMQTTQGGSAPVAEVGFRTATLSGLCGIATQTLGGLNVSLMIMAGVPVRSSFDTGANTTQDGAGNAISFDSSGNLTAAPDNISASNLYLSTNNLSGFGNLINGLNLGQSAETVTTGNPWPTGMNPTAGQFGLQADHLNVGGLSTTDSTGAGTTYGINLAGQITLPRLKIRVLTGSKTQADCPSQAGS